MLRHPFTFSEPTITVVIEKPTVPKFNSSSVRQSLLQGWHKHRKDNPMPKKEKQFTTADSLTPGTKFKIGRQRNYRTVNKLVFLEGSNIPEHHKGKLLIIMEGCKQIVVDPKTKVDIFCSVE